MMAVPVAARQQIREMREHLKNDRTLALAELDEVFEQGEIPPYLLDGRYTGQIITTMFDPMLDSAAHLLMNLWMPWRGKSFDIECGIGDNLLTTGGRWAARILFPRYAG